MLLLKKFNIIKRNRSESAINAILDNDKQLFCNKNQYKCGYHITWEGKKFWLRSSYEFDYAKQLDEQRISYDVESIRIPYKSSINGKTKIMIPDFYIKDTNTVIEIKSDFTYNELDWIDRVRVLKEKGYNCKLILEKVEYNCDVIPKQRIRNNIDSLL